MKMPEIHAGPLSALSEDAQTIIYVDELEIGVFRLGDEVFAYENRCAHQGGPSCEGHILPKVVTVLGENQITLADRFSDREVHFVCPWHGWEYDMRTGRNAGNPKLRLRKFDVVQRDGEVYVQTG